MNKDEQIRRIEQNETYLDETTRTLQQLLAALDGYAAQQADREALYGYYGSPLWFADKQAQESGELPAGLKCGVLSEDAVYDLITAEMDMKRSLAALLQSLERELPAQEDA